MKRLTYRLPSGPNVSMLGELAFVIETNTRTKAPGDKPAGPWYSRIWPVWFESRLHTYRLPSDPKVIPRGSVSPPEAAVTKTAPVWPVAGSGAPVDPL